MSNITPNISPADIVRMIRSGRNPEQIMLSLLENGVAQSNPIVANLVQLARNGRTQEIEQIARNLCQQQGIDFDKEFNNFKSNLFKDINSK